MILFYIAFHPKALKNWMMTAGLLALHIAGAFPFSVTKTVALDSQQQKVDYSFGDSSGMMPSACTGIPF